MSIIRKEVIGGRQFSLLTEADEGLTCSSQYGLCE